MSKNKEFWITNITKANIVLSDLAVTIPAYKSINLLSKNYNLSLNQINKSIESGSIFKRKNKISIRKVQPQIIENVIEISDNFMPSRTKSILVDKEELHDELNISDDQYIEDSLDTIEIDVESYKQ